LKYCFDEYVLDVACRELRRRGGPVAIEPQVFDLIHYLLQQRDRVVSKDDLIKSVWGGRIVSDSALTTRINAARAAIADSGKSQRFIKTFPRKGFRFVGQVQEKQLLVQSAPPDRGVTQFVVRAEARSACVLMGDDETIARSALFRGRELVVAALQSRGGRILSTPTDTVIAATPDAAAGINAASAARRVLAEVNLRAPIESRVHYYFGIADGDFEEGVEGPAGHAIVQAAALAAQAHRDAVRLSEGVKVTVAADASLSTKVSHATENGLTDDGTSAGLPPQLHALDLGLPNRPSIILLPFKTIGDNRQEVEALSEGLRLDIQNALTKMSGLFLIGAGSAYALRGLAGTDAAKRAGVRYALEGSVQRTNDATRVNVQVVDALTDTVSWSEQYDRVLDSNFALQDEIATKVVNALDVKLSSGEQARIWHKCLRDPKARDCFYRGAQAFVRMTQDSIASARACFLRLSELAPGSPYGPTWIAMCLWFEATRGWAADPVEARQQAGVWAERAVAMEDADGQAHTVLGNVRLLQRRFDDASAIAHQALEIRPGCTNANAFLANVLLYCGDPKTAIVHARRAIRYMPVYPPWFIEILAAAYRDAAMPDLAVVAAREILRITPATLNGRLVLASALVRCGWIADARRVAAEVRELDANLTLGKWASSQPYREAAKLASVLDDLGRLGIPQ
jgi:adenylate cyclase